MNLPDHAYILLKGNPRYLADAQRNAEFHNSIIGAIIAFRTRKSRGRAEEAVKSALKRIAEERRKRAL